MTRNNFVICLWNASVFFWLKRLDEFRKTRHPWMETDDRDPRKDADDG